MSKLILWQLSAWTLLIPTMGWTSSISLASISLTAGRDNSIFSESTNSAGSATTLLAGRNNSGGNRRALLWFDLAGQLPAGASVTGVSLALHLDGAAQSETTARNLSLYRLAADWGEGTSGSGGPSAGQGQSAAPGDATWVHSFYNTQVWTNPGSDFNSTASATASVGVVPGFYTWGSTPSLISDVQGWLSSPANNFGWVLRSDESASGSVRRFQSREASDPSWRPTLTIEYQVPEPTTAVPAAWSLVACGGAWRRRRRNRFLSLQP